MQLSWCLKQKFFSSTEFLFSLRPSCFDQNESLRKRTKEGCESSLIGKQRGKKDKGTQWLECWTLSTSYSLFFHLVKAMLSKRDSLWQSLLSAQHNAFIRHQPLCFVAWRRENLTFFFSGGQQKERKLSLLCGVDSCHSPCWCFQPLSQQTRVWYLWRHSGFAATRDSLWLSASDTWRWKAPDDRGCGRIHSPENKWRRITVCFLAHEHTTRQSLFPRDVFLLFPGSANHHCTAFFFSKLWINLLYLIKQFF